MTELRGRRSSKRTGRVNRQTVDLSEYPDLVVIYIGMRAYSVRGLFHLARMVRGTRKVRRAEPDGLLAHEEFAFLEFPPHAGLRQYWRDFDALEAWTRELPHQAWWREFLTDARGTGFWHETYCLGAGVEAVYDDMRPVPGLGAFAPAVPAGGPMFSSRSRLSGERSRIPPVIPEEALEPHT